MNVETFKCAAFYNATQYNTMYNAIQYNVTPPTDRNTMQHNKHNKTEHKNNTAEHNTAQQNSLQHKKTGNQNHIIYIC